MRREVRLHRGLLLAFMPFLLLILLRLVAPVEAAREESRWGVVSKGAAAPVEAFLIIASLICAPLIVWMVARLLAPSFFTLPGGRTKVAVVVIVATVALIGYVVGRFDYRFVSCGEFEAAGDEPPPSCSRER
jgi:hypothetical protein